MVTREEVARIAKLAKLYVDEESLDVLTAEMDRIIAFADTVNAAGSEEMDFDNGGPQNVFREDEVRPSLDREDILQNAPDAENGYFVVRKRQL